MRRDRIAGGALFLGKIGIEPTTRGAAWFALAGIAVTLVTVIWGVVRTLHPEEGLDRGIRRSEAVGLQLVTGASVLLLLLMLPS